MPLTFLLAGIIIGVSVYAGLQFLWMLSRGKQRYLFKRNYLLYSAMCFLAVGVLALELVAYQTRDPALFVEVFRWRINLGALFMMLWAWFVYDYAQSGRRLIPVVLSAALVLVFLHNILSPYGQVFTALPELATLTLPWGEPVSFTHFSMTPLGNLTWVVMLGIFIYTYHSCYLLFRRGRRRQALLMSSSMSILILGVAGNYLVRSGVIEFVYPGAYAFTAMLVIMGAGLRRDILDTIERVHALADHLPASVYIKDPAGRYLMANSGFLERRGISGAQLRGKSDHDFHPPQIAEKFLHNDRQVLAQRRPLEFDEQLISNSGEIRYFRSIKFPLLDSDQQIYAVCGISTDITDRLQAQRQLEESETKYRAVFDNANDAILLLQDGRLVDCNATTCRMFGCGRDDIIGHTPLDISPPTQYGGVPSAQLAMEKINLALAGQPQLFEWLHRRLDGTLFDAEIHLNRFDFNGKPCIQGVVRDISERKRAELELARQRELLETSVNTTPGSYYMINSDGVVVYSNRAFQDVVGRTPEQLRQLNAIEQFVFADDLPLAYSIVDRAIASGSTVTEQLRVLNAQGETRTVLATATRFCIDEEIYIVGSAMDITDRVVAEEELRKYREHLEELVAERTAELEAANRELESFSYSVSHDLRAPLRSINGFTRALMEDYGKQLNTQCRDYLDRVLSSSVHMGHLIDDILKLSRIGRVSIHLRRVDLSAVAEGVIKQLRSEHPERQVSVRIAPQLIAYGDAALIGILMTNLIDNAWKYTSRTPAPLIEAGREVIDGHSVFYVRDNGAGFDMQYAGRLFSPFQRLHDDYPGTGIGLATVARIVHRHGGRIWPQSAVNQGTTFYFTLRDSAAPQTSSS